MLHVRHRSVHGFIGSILHFPEELRDNEFILTGYRIGYKGIKNGFRTMFIPHNDLVNVWTHFLGKLIFLVFFVLTLTLLPNMGHQNNWIEDEYFQQATSDDVKLYDFIETKLETLEDFKTSTTDWTMSQVEGVSYLTSEFARENFGNLLEQQKTTTLLSQLTTQIDTIRTSMILDTNQPNYKRLSVLYLSLL